MLCGTSGQSGLAEASLGQWFSLTHEFDPKREVRGNNDEYTDSQFFLDPNEIKC